MVASNKKNLKRKSGEDGQSKSLSSADFAASALPLQFDDDVPDFPRGFFLFFRLSLSSFGYEMGFIEWFMCF